MSAASENARWQHQRGLRRANDEPKTNMTTTDSAPASDTWATQLEQLRARYRHVRPPILAALNVLMHNENISNDEAKAQAALHGVKITAASISAAQRLLSRQDGVPATPAPTPAAPAPRRPARRAQPTGIPFDAEALIRATVAKLNAQGDAAAQRVRDGIRKAIAVLESIAGS